VIFVGVCCIIRSRRDKRGAYRVYQDPADLLNHLDEVGIKTAE
jgi:hypothetical protein